MCSRFLEQRLLNSGEKSLHFLGRRKTPAQGWKVRGGEQGTGGEGLGVFPVACGNSQPQKPSIFVGDEVGMTYTGTEDKRFSGQ